MGGRYKLVFWGAILVAAAATFGAYKLLAATLAVTPEEAERLAIAMNTVPFSWCCAVTAIRTAFGARARHRVMSCRN